MGRHSGFWQTAVWLSPVRCHTNRIAMGCTVIGIPGNHKCPQPGVPTPDVPRGTAICGGAAQGSGASNHKIVEGTGSPQAQPGVYLYPNGKTSRKQRICCVHGRHLKAMKASPSYSAVVGSLGESGGALLITRMGYADQDRPDNNRHST